MPIGYFNDLTNIRFTHLVAIDISHKTDWGKIVWNCICDCGKIVQVYSDNLTSGKTKSCSRPLNCDYAFNLRSAATSHHSLSYTKEHKVWDDIKQRCYNPNNSRYSHWGGKGITMYEPWINDFQAFYDYLQALPETLEQFQARTGEEGSLDRINNDSGYIPNNLRWATAQEQMQNRSLTKLNEQLVKFILWENKINNKQSSEIYKMLDIDIHPSAIRKLIAGKTWTNITIDKEITEYERFGTVNGVKI